MKSQLRNLIESGQSPEDIVNAVLEQTLPSRLTKKDISTKEYELNYGKKPSRNSKGWAFIFSELHGSRRLEVTHFAPAMLDYSSACRWAVDLANQTNLESYNSHTGIEITDISVGT